MKATREHKLKLRREHKEGNWQPIRIKVDYSALEVKYSFNLRSGVNLLNSLKEIGES